MHRIARTAAIVVVTGIAAAAQSAAALHLPANPATAAAHAAPSTATAASASVVPAQTPIQLQLETHLSTRDNKDGDGFAARVTTAVFYLGREVIPSGSILEGHIIRIQDERPVHSDSELMLKPDLLVLPNGQQYVVSAEVIRGDPNSAAKVDSEGTLSEPRGVMTSDVHHTEIGAGTGFVGGALAASATGAVVGAGLGAGVALGIWLVRRRHLELNPGSQLTVRLDRPLQLSPK